MLLLNTVISVNILLLNTVISVNILLLLLLYTCDELTYVTITH